MSFSPTAIPTGFDWADGITPLPIQPLGSGGTDTCGTQTPSGAVVYALPPGTDTTLIEEDADSPEIERAEQATFLHTCTTFWETAKNLCLGIGRGTFLQDSSGNITRVLSFRIKKMRPGMAKVYITAESISFDSPPDEFQIVPIDLGLDLIKHPRYSWALSPAAGDSGTYTTVGDTDITFSDLKSTLIRMIQTYRDAPFFPSADQVNGLIQSNVLQQMTKGTDGETLISVSVPVDSPTFDPLKPNIPPLWDGVGANLPEGNYTYAIIQVPVVMTDPTDPIVIAIAAAKEIISKLWRQEDTPYITGFQITWTQYFFAPPYLDGGGYIQDPLTVVPAYFMQPEVLQTTLARGFFGSNSNNDTVAPYASGNTIFDLMASLNPQCYSDDGTDDGKVSISWLRKADEFEFQRTWFRKTSVWVGSPVGNWDAQLYTQGPRPQNANDFVNPT